MRSDFKASIPGIVHLATLDVDELIQFVLVQKDHLPLYDVPFFAQNGLANKEYVIRSHLQRAMVRKVANSWRQECFLNLKFL